MRSYPDAHAKCSGSRPMSAKPSFFFYCRPGVEVMLLRDVGTAKLIWMWIRIRFVLRTHLPNLINVEPHFSLTP